MSSQRLVGIQQGKGSLKKYDGEKFLIPLKVPPKLLMACANPLPAEAEVALTDAITRIKRLGFERAAVNPAWGDQLTDEVNFFILV